MSASLFAAEAASKCAAEDNSRGAQLAAICASCHRLDGGGSGIASIIGLDPEELAGMMQAFKADETSSHIMHVVGLSLSGDEIAALARYLAALAKEAATP